MNRKKIFIIISLALAIAVTGWGVDQTRAQSKAAAQPQKAVKTQPIRLAQADPEPQADEQAPADLQPQSDVQKPDSDVVAQEPASTGSERLDNYLRMYGITPAQREAAARRAAEKRAKAAADGEETNKLSSFAAPLSALVSGPGGYLTPDYFGTTPNYANSPTTIQKFIDLLPGLGSTNANSNGQYIPVANPDTTTYSGSDYYEIGLKEYDQQLLHSPTFSTTKLRGYYQINSGTVPPTDHNNMYLGPLIIAKKDRPVRIKFENKLSTGTGGNLFIPVDTTAMGAGIGPDTVHSYTQNRAVVHLHGGATPWISDGTPHQWITPPSDPLATYYKGLSFQNVPDMVGAGKLIPTPSPTDGLATLYYTNQQSGRLMFYHDHAYGLTRLNVYAGEAAGYLLWDNVENDLIMGTNASGANPGLAKVIPGKDMVDAAKPEYKFGIPLIIQDKTFVDATTIASQDPTWNWGTNPGTPGTPGAPRTGDLWFPHVYMPNQNPYDDSGANAMGRWDYGPWFWPPLTTAAGLVHGEVSNPYYTGPSGTEPSMIPGTPNPSLVPEAFMDTPMVNGATYPYLPVERKAYRFRILNACNDRFLNLQLYYADTGGSGSGGSGASATATVVAGQVTGFTSIVGGSGYTTAPGVYISDSTGSGASAIATVSGGSVTGIAVINGGSGYTFPTIKIGDTGEVKMVPAVETAGYPDTWPTDGRAGGVPDYLSSGPQMIQIGTEGGFLPAPVVLPNQPVSYNYNRRDIVVLNVENKTLFLGPAERADVIIDFSGVPAGSKLILYNDAPAPVPAFDPRLDYYTGDPDQTTTGGVRPTVVGYGPNTRTIMQFQVQTSSSTPFSLSALNAAWPAAYRAIQPTPIVPEAAYGPTYGTTFTNTYSRIQSTSLTFTPVGGTISMTQQLLPKAIQELFELDYGRMNATLGVELPKTNFNIQTTVPLGYVDPITETLHNGQSQIWKITHNGVDTHAIHFHLFNVQVINRVGWDGAIRPPDANELGWKETVRMNPLEDCIVAFKPVLPTVPFAIPNSSRPLDVTQPVNAMITVTNPTDGNPLTIPNALTNFGNEYVWHCHLLGHEENDMMRPMKAVSSSVRGDFNADGMSDVIWQKTGTGRNEVWLMSGGDLATYIDPIAMPANWKIVGTGDFNGDRTTDLIWQQTGSGRNEVWLMSGGDLATYIDPIAMPANWKIVGTGDFNGDRTTDLIWQQTGSGRNEVWLMSNGNYSSYIDPPIMPATWNIAGTGDFNGDGTTDLIWQQTGSGRFEVWLMSNGNYSSYIDLPIMPDTWNFAGTGDFNGDGTTDLIWENAGTLQLEVWLMRNGNLASYIDLSAMTAGWNIVGTGDFNGDGTDDLIWQNAGTGQNQVWLMYNGNLLGVIDPIAMPAGWEIVGPGPK